MGEGSSLGRRDMSSVSHCVSVLLQTSTGFSVSAPVPLWAAPRQGIWLCSMAFVYLCIHHPVEAHPKELGMAKVPRRCYLRAGAAKGCGPMSCSYADTWLMFSSAFSWSKAGTTFS